MRLARMTYDGAMHHISTQGKKGFEIFSGNRGKMAFLELLKENLPRYKLKLFGYCILDNECHMVLENSSGRMADFLKTINGQFGMLYRKRSGKHGTVFHDRYKSVLIRGESELKTAIAYILNIPVQHKIVDKPEEYIWSSVGDYFGNSGKKSRLIESQFVKNLFGDKKEFRRFIGTEIVKQYRRALIRNNEYGYILGDDNLPEWAIEKNRERLKAEKMRGIDTTIPSKKHFEPAEKIIDEFEKTNNVKLNEINTHKLKGKRLRIQLLLQLKEKAGLTYPEIHRIPIFSELKIGSMGRLFKRVKEMEV